MRFPALHVNRAEPTRPQDLGDAACIVAIRLVSHRAQRGAHLARLHANDVKPVGLQSVGQVLAQGASLKANAFDWKGKYSQVARDLFDLARQVSFMKNRALAVENTNRTGSQRYIQASIIFHSKSPLFTVSL